MGIQSQQLIGSAQGFVEKTQPVGFHGQLQPMRRCRCAARCRLQTVLRSGTIVGTALCHAQHAPDREVIRPLRCHQRQVLGRRHPLPSLEVAQPVPQPDLRVVGRVTRHLQHPLGRHQLVASGVKAHRLAHHFGLRRGQASKSFAQIGGLALVGLAGWNWGFHGRILRSAQAVRSRPSSAAHGVGRRH